MREILFRGKRIDNDEWEYGGCVFTENKVCLIYNQTHSIDLQGYTVENNSLGQYTGLTDKNGRKILEGDIVDCLEFYGEVYYDPEGCFDLRDNTPEMCGGFIGDYNSLEVVGNIYDNPELLEVSE